MAVLSVRRYGDPVLRQKAKPVTEVTPEIERTIQDMVETMYQQVGIGLAAPQVGFPLRLVVMDDGKRGTRALKNFLCATQPAYKIIIPKFTHRF